MIISDIDAFCAELDAILAAEGFSAPVRGVDPAVLAAEDRADPVADPRPQTVAELMRALRKSGQGKQPFFDPDDDGGQYADTTHLTTHDSQLTKEENEDSSKPRRTPKHLTKSSSAEQEDRSSAVYKHASRTPLAPVAWSGGLPLRKPKRKASRLDEVALNHTWSGTKSKKRKDKLDPAKKFVAAIWSTAAAKGVAVTLNLGIRRESMLIEHADPHRQMMLNLNRHLSKAGFGDLAYAFVFELTPDRDYGRLHLHGVIDTSGLSDADMGRLREALRAAASYASGAIGGERQLHMAPLYDAVGWSDYLLKDATRTARETGIKNVFMMSNPMTSAANRYFDELRNEVQLRVKKTVSARSKTVPTASIRTTKPLQGFTPKSHSGINVMSGERDKKLAGGVSQQARHRPQLSRARRIARRPVSMAPTRSQSPRVLISTSTSSARALRCVG